MATELIDSYVDRAGIEGDTKYLLDKLRTVQAELEKTAAIKVDLKGSNGLAAIIPTMQAAQAAIKDVKQASEDLIASQKKGETTQKQFDKAIAEGTIEKQKYNAELKKELELQNAATGSIEQARALVKNLTAERNKLNLTTEAGRKRQGELNLQIDKANDFIRENVDLLAKQKINIGNYAGSAKIITDAFERARGRLVSVEKQFGSLSPEAKAVRGEMEALGRVTSNPQFLNISAKVGDTTSELKFFTKQLNVLEDAGQKNSTTYREIQARLASLTDQLGDTRAEIKALSSDTRSFDLFAGSVSFAADAMQTAAGASVLFGASEEDAAAATRTLTAVQSVANGVKGIATELTTKGTAANKAYNFVMKEVSIITGNASTATQKFNSVLKLTGIGLLITGISTLISKLDIFGTSTKEAISLADQLTESFENQRKAIEGIADDLDFQSKLQIEKLKQQGAGDKVIFDAELQRKKEHLKELEAAETDARNKRGKAETFYANFVTGVNGKVAKETKEQAEKVSKVLNDEVEKRAEAAKKQRQEIALAEEQFITKQVEERRAAANKNNDKDSKDAIKEALDRQKEIDEALERLREENAQRTFDRKTAEETLNDELESRLDIGAKNYEKEKLQNEIFRDNQLADNQKALDAGLRDEKKFTFRKEQIHEEYQTTTLQNEIDFYEVQIGILKAFGADTLALEASLAKARLALSEVKTPVAPDGVDPEVDRQKKLAKTISLLGKVRDKYNDLAPVIGGAVDAATTSEKNKLQEQIDALDKKKQKDIEIANQTILNEKDKAAAIAVIEATSATQREQLERKQKEAERKKAIFDKAAAIATIAINTAIAISKAIASAPPPFNAAAIIYAAALGAAQLAVAVATPIPRFKHGKDKNNRYEGPAIVDDGGKPEAIIRESGAIEIGGNKPRLTFVGKKDIVLPDANMLINHVIAGHMGGSLKVQQSVPLENNNVEKEIKAMRNDIVSAIKSKKELHLSANESGLTAMWKHGANQIKYIEDQTNW